MLAVNWGEVFHTEWRDYAEVGARGRRTIAGSADRAIIAASLGYAYPFAAELAIEREACLVTADPEFEKIGKGLSIQGLPRQEK